MPPPNPATLEEKLSTWTVEGVLLFEDFEGVSASTWGEIEAEEGNHVLRSEEEDISRGEERWQDYALDFRFKIESGVFSTVVRWQESEGKGSYTVHVNPEWVEIGKAPGDNMLGEVSLDLAPYRWYRMSVVVAGGTMSVLVDEEQVLDVEDLDPILWGKIGFRAGPGSSVHLDDVRVSGRY